MTHLVLGSAGQIGYHLVNYLKSIDEKVIEFDLVYDREQDLRLYNNTLLEKVVAECDYVHFLAFDIGGSAYMKKYQDTYGFIDNNIKIMDRVFQVLEQTKKPFTFASSQMSNMNYSTYGLLKAIGEKYTEALGGLIVKFWNVYGYEKDEEKSHVITDFIKMAKETKVIKMRTTGKEQRQFLYGDDCAECLVDLTKQYRVVDRNKPLHVTSFVWSSIEEIAQTIHSIIDCTVVPGEASDEVQKDKRNEPDPYILNYWKPKTSLTEGIWKISSLY